MKKLLLLAVVTGLAVGCSSSKKQNQGAYYNGNTNSSYTNAQAASNPAKYQIIDQEFENYVVENDNYDRIAPYEEQINVSSYIQGTNGRSKDNKPNRVVPEKTVVDGNGNILSSNAKAPVTDQETLPDGSGTQGAQD